MNLGSTELDGIQIEYMSLRDEILKRIDLRQLFLSITLGFAGAFLGAALAHPSSPSISLIYPPIALFLAVGWIQNDYQIRVLAAYIREQIENRVPGIDYETYIQKKRMDYQKSLRNDWLYKRWWHSLRVSHIGLILTTQLIAIIIGISIFKGTPLEYILISIDLISIFLVLHISRLYAKELFLS